MISKTMQRYLESLKDEHLNKYDKLKYSVYINRMQKSIDRDLKMLIWLAVNYPEILLNKDKSNEYGTVVHSHNKQVMNGHQRLRLLLSIILAAKPKMEVELVLKNLKMENNNAENLC